MIKPSILPFMFLCLLTHGYAAGTESISVITSNVKNNQATVEKIDEQQFDESFMLASSQVSDIFNAASEVASSELPEAFQLQEIEVGLGVSASAGLFFWSVAAEGGVVLHFTKRE